MLSASTENYLKHIYYINEGSKVNTGDLAKLLKVAPASATKMIKKLNELGFVEYTSHHGFKLTKVGLTTALKVLRKHRLLELFLVEKLNYSWDEVHEEACELEHHISDKFADRLFELLGNPQFDPHGDPIPSKDGKLPKSKAVQMSELKESSKLELAHVSDSNNELLRYLDELELKPGTEFIFKEKQAFGGPYTIKINKQVIMLGPEAAENIYVNVLEEYKDEMDIA